MSVLYDKGIVVIPKKVWQSAGLKRGARLHIRSEGRKVVIEPEEDALADFLDLCKNAKSTGKQVEKGIKAAEARMKAEALDVH